MSAVDILTEVGKAIGFLQEDGTLNLSWFGDPAGQIQQLDARRGHLLSAIEGLLQAKDTAGPAALPFGANGPAVPGGEFYPFDPAVPVEVVLMPAATPHDSRLVGLGAKHASQDGSIQLAAQAWLLGLDNGPKFYKLGDPQLDPPILARARFDKLGKAITTLDVAAALTLAPSARVQLTLTPSVGTPKSIVVDPTSKSALWQCLDLGVFALTSIVRDAAKNIPAVQRLLKHLLPLFDGSDPAIPSFPLAILTGAAPNPNSQLHPVSGWLQGIASAQATALKAALGHLWSLVTGSDAPNLVAGPAGSWIGWLDTDPKGRLGLRAVASSGALQLGVIGETSKAVGTATARFALTADVFNATWNPASNAPPAFAGPSALQLELDVTLADKRTLALGVKMDKVRGVVPFLSATDANGQPLLDPTSLSSVQAAAQAQLSALTSAIAAFQQGQPGDGAVKALITLAQAVTGTAPSNNLLTLSLGASFPFQLQIGQKGTEWGVWLVPLAPVTKGALTLGGSAGAVYVPGPGGWGGRASFTLSLPLDAAGVPFLTPTLSITAAAGKAPAVDLQLNDPDKLDWTLGPTFQPPPDALGALVRSVALPLLVQLAQGALQYKVKPFLPNLGQILVAAGLLATPDGGKTFTIAPNAGKSFDPLVFFTTLVKVFLDAASGQKFGGTPISATIKKDLGSTHDIYGVEVQPASNPIIKTGPVSLGVDGIDLGLLRFSNNKPVFAPALGFNNLAITAPGTNAPPLLSFAGLKLGHATLTVSPSVDDKGFKLNDLKFKLADLELPFLTSGVIGNLVGKDASIPNLSLTVEWRQDKKPHVIAHLEGKASFWIDLNAHLGPIDLRRLGVRFYTDGASGLPKLELILDGSFSLGGIEINPDGFGLDFPLAHLPSPDKWSIHLDGLGIGFDEGGVTIDGLFKHRQDEYLGAALISAFSFQLGAVGAYGNIKGKTSFFIFASLGIPLGGPPFFFVTGLAAGFGYNRGFSAPNDINQIAALPFFQLMKGKLDLGTVADQLATCCPPELGAIWLAGGVTFTSFVLIRGQAILYAKFGNGFEIGLLALAQFDIPTPEPVIAHVELAMMIKFSTAGDDPYLLVMAGVTDASWLLGGTCKLHGGFALKVWFNRGECVFTAGGYHPDFKVPDQAPDDYPMVPRIGFRWGISDAIVLKGDTYFALVPNAAMGGAHFDLTGHWGPLSAGLSAWFDALIHWDPFWFVLDIGVKLWGALDTFLGRIEIDLGVELSLHGPPIGGTATIDLAIFSIDIPFGSQHMPGVNPLNTSEFLKNQLHLTPTQQSLPKGQSPDDWHVWSVGRSIPATDGAKDDGVHGLFTIEVEKGLLTQDQETALAATGGAESVTTDRSMGDGSQARPYLVTPEFALRIHTLIPLAHPDALIKTNFNAGPGNDATLKTANVALPQPRHDEHPKSIGLHPCAKGGVTSVLDLQTAHPPTPLKDETLFGSGDFKPLFKQLPEAMFSESDQNVPPDTTLMRCAGVTVIGNPLYARALAGVHQLTQEDPGKVFPLPLAPLGSGIAAASARLPSGRMTWQAIAQQAPALSARLRRSGTALPRLLPLGAGITEPADVAPTLQVAPVLMRAVRPAVLSALEASTQRAPRLVARSEFHLPPARAAAGRVRTTTGALAAAKQAPRVPAPSPVARRADLAGVGLHVVERDAPVSSPPAPRVLRRTPGAHPAALRTLSLTTAALGGGAIPIAAGSAQLLEVDGSVGGKGATLQVDGTQMLRVTCLGAWQLPLSDAILPPGQHAIPLPAATRQVLVAGLGVLPAGTPIASGVQADTVLLRVGDRAYAGPGCVLVVRRASGARWIPHAPSGRSVLDRISEVQSYFSATAGTLAIVVTPPEGAAPPLASALRWRSPNGALGAPMAVAAHGQIALLFDLGSTNTGGAPLRVDVAVGSGYRLAALSVVPGDATSLSRRLASAALWDFVDERRGPAGTSHISLEVKP